VVDAARLARRVARAATLAGSVEEELWPPLGPEGKGALLDYVRRTGTTVHHPCDTCRMGTDAGAVVDPTLRLRTARAACARRTPP
jgi:choline dehydrogenase